MTRTARSARSWPEDAPAERILETGHLVAFLHVWLLFRGHTLLVPKAHLRLLSDLPAELAAEFLTTAQRLERAVEDGLARPAWMILVNNVVSQSVPHLHLHVIPRNPKDGLASCSGRCSGTTPSTQPWSTPRRSAPRSLASARLAPTAGWVECSGPTVTVSWAGLPLDTEPAWSAPPVGAMSS